MSSVVLLLTLLNLAANIMWIEHVPGSGMAIAIFSADREMTLPTWWSALVLAGLGLLSWLMGNRRQGKWIKKLPWWTLAAGFLFLSADEACMLHERLGGIIKLEGAHHHARWIVLWLPPALIISGAALWQLWRSYRLLVIGLMLGMLLYVGGAVGVELINAMNRHHVEAEQKLLAEQVVDTNQSFAPSNWRRNRAYYPYMIGTSVEELLEMLAPMIWLWVLLDKRNTLRLSGAPQQVRPSTQPQA